MPYVVHKLWLGLFSYCTLKNNTLNLQKWLSYQELKPLLNNSSLLTMTGWGKYMTTFWGKPKAKTECTLYGQSQSKTKQGLILRNLCMKLRFFQPRLHFLKGQKNIDSPRFSNSSLRKLWLNIYKRTHVRSFSLLSYTMHTSM